MIYMLIFDNTKMSSNIVLITVVGLFVLLPTTDAAPAFLVFGDSLCDVGNNNYVFTLARADTPPYGIDFPPSHQPTGRFSNGYNLADLIGKKIGAELVLPYLSPNLTGDKLCFGANFASGGVGILNDTGSYYLDNIKIWDQLQLFEEYQSKLSDLLGKEGAWQLVNRAFVLITLGSNDFINNYFTSSSPWPSRLKIKDFCKFIISEYRKILLRLYELGVQRVLVSNLGPIGCAPAELAKRSKTGKCVPRLQRASAIYDPMLVEMIEGLNKKLKSLIFLTPTKFNLMDVLKNPEQFGFSTRRDACCGTGPYNGRGQCNMDANLCLNRSQYIFWDNFHPTERATRLIVDHIMDEYADFINPINQSTNVASS